MFFLKKLFEKKKAVSASPNKKKRPQVPHDIERRKQPLCFKCGSGSFTYEEYWKEYTCDKCGWIYTSLDAKPEAPELVKNKSRYSIFNKAGKKLSLLDLGKPLFPIVAYTDLEREKENSPLSPLLKMRASPTFDSRKPSQEFLNEAERLIRHYPQFDIPYYWLASYYIVLGQYAKAEALLQYGMNNVSNRSLLATVTGTLELRQSRPIAIGWFMQACLLATIEFMPYRLCAVVAEAVGNEAFYWRLRNAAEIMSTKYSPSDENEITNLVGLADKEELLQALKIFESNMQDFLPGDSDIPKEKKKREVFLSIKQDYLRKARAQLLRK